MPKTEAPGGRPSQLKKGRDKSSGGYRLLAERPDIDEVKGAGSFYRLSQLTTHSTPLKGKDSCLARIAVSNAAGE